MLVRMVVQGLMAVLYALEITALLWVTHPNYKEKYYVGVKTLCSISFVGIALLFAAISKHWDYFWNLLPALVLCALGDLFMALYQVRRKKRQIFLGIFVFLCAHVSLLVLLFSLDDTFSLWNILFPLAALAVFLILKFKVRLHLGRLLLPASIYCVFLSLMLSKCLQYMYLHPAIASGWIGLGGTLFFISDVTIIFLYFYKFPSKDTGRRVHYMNLVTYYFGILAFDMSILYLVRIP